MSSDLEKLLYGTDKKIRTLQLVINSRDRVDYGITTSSNFRVNLQNPINSKLIAYGLESVSIPKTNYNISSPMNVFEIEDSTGPKTITIPPGNYSASTFIAELVAQLNASGDSYTVVKSSLTNKLTITSSFTGFIVNPDTETYPLLIMMGFDDNTTYISVVGVLDAPNVMNISGPTNLYIKIAQLTEYMRDTKNLSSNFKIDYGCEYGSNIYFSNQSKYLQYYTTSQDHLQRTEHFDIQLVDEAGNLVDLNGSNWSLVLRFVTKDLY